MGAENVMINQSTKTHQLWVVGSTDKDTFLRDLSLKVQELENDGYQVDIQYSFNKSEMVSHHAAFIRAFRFVE